MPPTVPPPPNTLTPTLVLSSTFLATCSDMAPDEKTNGFTRGWLRYLLVWCIVLGAASSLASIRHAQTGGVQATMVLQFILGASFGAICATLFTLFQNVVNRKRRAVVSWICGAVVFAVAVLIIGVRGLRMIL